MADRFYLSLWLRDYQEEQMIDRFRVLLEAFPYSASRPLARSIRVHPLSFSEHPVLEEDFPEGAETAHILGLASEFLHGDYAFESTVFWDLWVFQKNGGPAAWRQLPHPVTLLCYGPEFEERASDRGDLQADFGLDTPFRADQPLPDADARRMVGDYRERLQQNMRKLLDFVQVLEKRLPVEKRLLWTETGENFAEMIRQSFR